MSRPNRKARRKLVREAYERAVDDAAKEKSRRWLEQHPPHAVVPMSRGHWRSRDPYDFNNVYEVNFQPTPMPPSLIWQVPIMASAPERIAAMERSYIGSGTRTFEMRAVEWETRIGHTVLRWWNWEPIFAETDAEAATYSAARGAFAMMQRLEPHMKLLAEMDPYGRMMPWSEAGSRFPLPGELALKYWRESVELLGTWLGMVKTKYVVPGKSGQSEERVSESRRP